MYIFFKNILNEFLGFTKDNQIPLFLLFFFFSELMFIAYVKYAEWQTAARIIRLQKAVDLVVCKGHCHRCRTLELTRRCAVSRAGFALQSNFISYYYVNNSALFL